MVEIHGNYIYIAYFKKVAILDAVEGFVFWKGIRWAHKK